MAGIDTYLSVLYSRQGHRIPPLDFALVDLDTWGHGQTLPVRQLPCPACLHAIVQFPWVKRERNNVVEWGRKDKRMYVDSGFSGSSGVSRSRGVSDECQGTGTRPLEGRKRQKSPTIERSRGFTRMSCLRWPGHVAAAHTRGSKIYMTPWFNFLKSWCDHV